MVKLQKSLTKPVEIVEKKKKKLLAPPLAGISKTSKKDKSKAFENVPKSKKETLVKAIIKDAEVVVPLTNEKKEKLKKVSKKVSNEQTKETSSKYLKKEAVKAKKRPLVLAPPESPAAPKSIKSVLRKKPLHQKKPKVQKDEKINSNEEASQLTKLQKKKAAKRAFRKQQIKKRRENKLNKVKKAPPKRLFKAPPFDEEKFNAIVNEDAIKNIAKGLKKQVEKEVSEKKTAIFSDFQYFLNVACFKIPNDPKRVVKLNLKHALVDKDDDVAIIVSDLQRGAKVDYEPTIQHYEDIFREAGIEGLTIIPFNKLRNECNTFETVRKFGNSYDYFLCDGRLVGHAAGFCGKVFQKPRTTFHSVRMGNQTNLKREIEKSLRRTAYKRLQKGDLMSIPVGNHKFTEDQLAENVMYVLEQLKKTYPGGFPNIRGIYLKISIAGTSSLPIYLSAAKAPENTPYIVGPREERLIKMKREANEVLTQFEMTKEGKLLQLSKKDLKRKQKLRDMRAAMETEDTVSEQKDADETNGKQCVVPTKKAKIEKGANKTDKEKSKDEKSTVKESDEGEDSEEEQEDGDDHDSKDDGVEDDDDDDDGDDDDNDDDGDDDDNDDEDDDNDDDDDDDDDDDEDDDDEEIEEDDDDEE